MNNGERQFNRKCSICHTLTGGSARRAGPTLAGVFGREAGAVEGYNYTQALESGGIIWSAETIGSLFELGPTCTSREPRCPCSASQKNRIGTT